MRYREKLNIIIMRDNGPRHSYHIRRSRFILLVLFCLCLPFLTLLLTTQCWLLWQENVALRSNMERFEADYQAAETKAERLENLEVLLREENVPGREIILRQLAQNVQPEQEGESKGNGAFEESLAEAEGPGHEEFPELDTGRVKVGNVQVRALRGNLLRIGLDLRNPDNEPLLSGQMEAFLVTSDGERRELKFDPEEVRTFRISRFKRAVMVSQLPKSVNLNNAQLILEVRDQDGKELYRNIFAVQR